MKLELATVSAFAIFFAGSALADQDSDAITKFGLVGHWAVRCREQPGPQNPHRFFVASPIGNPIEQLAGGDPPANGMVLLLSKVHILSPDQIAYTSIIGGTLYNFMLTKSGNKHRTMDVISATGQAITSHGILTATGAETVWVERCSD
jgi:hypothetical protein